MLASGLGRDLEAQRVHGVETLQSLTGTTLQTDVARPTAGSLSDDAIGWLADSGATTVLGNVDTVARHAQGPTLNPDPTATVNAPDGSNVTLVLPDPGVEGLLARPDLVADPVRAAQAVLGELAVIWKESPVPEGGHVRGVALALPSSLSPGMWTPMLERLHRTPFMRLEDAASFVAGVNPSGEPAVLRSPDASSFPPSYIDQIREQQHRIGTYDSILTRTEPGAAGAHQRRLLRGVGVLRHGLGGRDLVVERGVRGDAASLRQRQATGRSGDSRSPRARARSRS
jgi:hypothetical protein